MKPVIATPPRTMMEVYKSLPEGTLAELIDDKLYMSPSPVFSHQKTIQEIFRKLCLEVLDKQKGEVIISPYDVYLDETNNAVQPDIIVVLNENIKIIDRRGHIHGVPDILIEVLSPHNRDHDQKLKKDLYERFRVKEYWIVDPQNKSTTVYELENNRYKILADDTGIVRSRLLDCFFEF